MKKQEKNIYNLKSIFQSGEYKTFLFVMLIFGIVVGFFSGTLNNFLHEILGMDELDRGFLELPREAPGLLLILIIALLFRSSEVYILRLSIIIGIAGFIGLGFLGQDRILAVICIVFWSTGEHILMPIRQSIGIHMAQKGKEGQAMGTVASAGNIGMVIGYFTVPVIFFLLSLYWNNSDKFSYFQIIFVIGSVLLLIALLVTGRLKKKDDYIKRQKLYFHKKYTKYYILEFFFGARKQVFLTFAPFILVKVYNAETQVISLLFGIYATLSIFFSPLVGRLIDKLGYKKVIVMDSILLVLLCIGYGFAHIFFNPNIAFIIICTIFIIDGMLFAVGIARAKYVRNISNSKEEVTSTLSTGISINHLISIVIALIGGLIWFNWGIELLFLVAALFGVGSFAFSLSLPSHSERTE